VSGDVGHIGAIGVERKGGGRGYVMIPLAAGAEFGRRTYFIVAFCVRVARRSVFKSARSRPGSRWPHSPHNRLGPTSDGAPVGYIWARWEMIRCCCHDDLGRPTSIHTSGTNTPGGIGPLMSLPPGPGVALVILRRIGHQSVDMVRPPLKCRSHLPGVPGP